MDKRIVQFLFEILVAVQAKFSLRIGFEFEFVLLRVNQRNNRK
jgi:hypothetical protein